MLRAPSCTISGFWGNPHCAAAYEMRLSMTGILSNAEVLKMVSLSTY